MGFCPTRATLNKRLLPSFGEMKLAGTASSYVYLYYLVFMKKLAKAAHAEAFKRKSLSLKPEDVAQVSKKLCRQFSFLHRLGHRRARDSSNSSSSDTRKPGAHVQKAGLKSKKTKKIPFFGKEAKRKLAVPKKTSVENYVMTTESSEQESSDVSPALSGSDDASSSLGSSSDVI